MKKLIIGNKYLIWACKKFEPLFLSDESYLKVLFFLFMGYKLDLITPKTYSEKIQWLKLYNRKAEYSLMVDKYAVKNYVGRIIGEQYIIPTYGVWNNVEDIDWDHLPNQFVIKSTHAGGGLGVEVCKDKSQFDIPKAKKNLKQSFLLDIFKIYKEWPYKNVKKRIIAEKYLEETGLPSLRDYKVMCFDGKVKMIEFHEGRFTSQHTQTFYDREWEKLPINQKSYGVISDEISERPVLLGKMIELSEILAEDIPHLRVDWYIVDNNLYFGEITFYDASGFDAFIPEEYNYIIGELMTLPEKI